MKHILGVIALSIAALASFTGCNNQPPFAKLIVAVDSANVAMQQEPVAWTDSTTITYDEVTNAVKYTFYINGPINKDLMAQGAEATEAGFIAALAQNPRFNLTGEIVDAKANVLLDFKGDKNTEYELLIENQRIANAFYAANPELKK